MARIHTPELPGLDKERASVEAEIGNNIELVGASSVEAAFATVSGGKAAAKFLKTSNLYDTTDKRWVDIELPKEKEDRKSERNALRSGILEILTKIMSGVASKLQQKGRDVIDTHTQWFWHSRTHSGEDVRSSPDIVVTGVARDGCSFEKPRYDKAGFENMVTCIETRTASETKTWTLESITAHMGTYAKQVFIHQPNRISFRCIWVTEIYFRFFHFDRAGCQLSFSIDLHEAPKLFIQVFLGISSIKEEVVGFDTSIKFTFEKGVKIGGFIFANDGRKQVRYPLIYAKPIYTLSRLLGRGVTCWLVEDRRRGRDLVVKDSWEDGWEDSYFPSESELLRKAVGLTGVMQLVAAEDMRKSICDIRLRFKRAYPLIVTFQWRLVTEGYGKDIGHFTSEKILFEAMRDAIAGHMNLAFDERSALLHRDISRRNILLGNRGAEPGWRGVLIDLDKSWNIEDVRTSDMTGYAVGTQIYKSISVLRGESNVKHREISWHDCYDDLESFLYVLVDVMLEKELVWESGKWAYRRKAEMPALIVEWAEEGDATSSNSKLEFLLAFEELSIDSIGLGSFWSPAARTLLTSFSRSIKGIFRYKRLLPLMATDRGIQKHLEFCRKEQAEEAYAKILALFDKAIAEASENPGPSLHPTPARTPLSAINTNSPGGLGLRKRVRGEVDSETPTAKRGKALCEEVSREI